MYIHIYVYIYIYIYTENGNFRLFAAIELNGLAHLCGKHTRTGDPNPTLRSAGRAGAGAGGSDTERWNSLGFLVSSPHLTQPIFYNSCDEVGFLIFFKSRLLHIFSKTKVKKPFRLSTYLLKPKLLCLHFSGSSLRVGILKQIVESGILESRDF
jgi:hypothetical protein